MEWIPIILLFFKLSVLFIGMFFAIKWHYDQDRKDEDNGPQFPSEMRLFAAMLIALALSLIGIVYAGFWGNAADGGRGGALGCALTLLIFIIPKPNAEAVLADHNKPVSLAQSDALAEPDPTTLSEGLDQLARLKIQTGHLRATFAARLESAEREKIYLIVASIMSTLAWKYGDIAATWLGGR